MLKRTSRFQSAVLVAALVLRVVDAHAEDKANALPLSKWAPSAAVTAENQKSQFEAGIQGNFLVSPCVSVPVGGAIPAAPGDCRKQVGYTFVSPRLYFDVPFTSDDSTVARADQYISTWQVGASLGIRTSDWNATDTKHLKFKEWYFALDGKVSPNSYTYQPDGLDEKTKKWRVGFTTKLKLLRQSFSKDHAGWAPQLVVGYTRNYKASDKVPVVSVADVSDAPIVGKSLVVSPPSATPMGFLRLSLLRLSGTDETGFGLSSIYSISGAKDGYGLSGGAQRFNFEIWGYYFPIYAPAKSGGPKALTNLRMGVAPFVSVRTKGDDDQAKVYPGVLLELRATTSEFEY